MSAVVQARPRTSSPWRIRPRPRSTELTLLAFVALAMAIGSASLGATQRFREAVDTGATPEALDFAPIDPRALLVYLGALGLVHLLFVLAGRRTDQVLLPAAGMLGGIGLLLMQRLPQGLVTQSFFGTELMLAQVQLVWLVIALTIVTVLALAIRSDAWLRTYKYTWAAVGIALLLATFVLGSDVNGARLTLSIGPLSGQPSELLKVILVVFLAGYLSENRSLLADENTQLGPNKQPPIP
jgi:hypothetical protein